jgi:type II secretory pathway pseudopilin PulG
MATIATLLIAAAGAAIAAYGAYSSAKAQQTQLKQQAYMQEAEAEQARQAGIQAARRQRAKDKAAQESFGARAAMAGVVAHEGSALLTEMDFAEESEMQALHVQHGYEVQASRARTEASFARWQAGRISPMMAAVTSGIGSLASSAGGSFGGIATGATGAGKQTGGGLTTSPTSGAAYSAHRAGERQAYGKSWTSDYASVAY